MVAPTAERALTLPPPPWVIAHRGASGERLENTLESCRRAVELGAAMLEVDVQLTADGVPVVIHDGDLMRLAGDPRRVEEMAAAELQAIELSLPLRAWGQAAASPGERLRGNAPTLAALLAALPAGYPLNLELKPGAADRARFAAALAAVVGGRAQLLLSSFDHQLLAAAAAALPGVPTAPIAARDGAVLLAAGERLGAWSLGCHQRLVTAELAAAARRAGRPLLAYTVNDPAAARRLLACGVAGLFTDWPDRMLAALAAGP